MKMRRAKISFLSCANRALFSGHYLGLSGGDRLGENDDGKVQIKRRVYIRFAVGIFFLPVPVSFKKGEHDSGDRALEHLTS